jgi:hypothetical protein
VIEHQRGGEVVVSAGAGDLPRDLVGQSVDAEDSVAGAALRTSRTPRLEDEPNRDRGPRPNSSRAVGRSSVMRHGEHDDFRFFHFGRLAADQIDAERIA